MKRSFTHLLLLAFFFVYADAGLYGQDSPQDSLKTIWLSETSPDSLRFEAGLKVYMSHFRSDPDQARAIGRELIEFARARENAQWEAVAQRYLGNSYASAGDYTKALELYEASLSLSRQSKDLNGIATLLSNIGTVHYELGNYPLAIEKLLEALQLSEELEDKPSLARVTNNLGNVYLKQRNNEKALEYYQYSLRIKEELNYTSTLANAYNNLGLVQEAMGNYPDAIRTLQESARLAEEEGDRKGQTRAYNNLGSVYLSIGEYDEALKYLNGSILVKTEIADRDGLAHAYAYRGRAHLALSSYQAAVNDCEKSLGLATQMEMTGLQKEACSCLSKAHEKLGNFSSSLEYLKQATALQDSLFSREKTEEITRQEMQYTFEKQQLADSIAYHRAQAERQLNYERDLNRQRNLFYLLVFGGAALIVLIGLIWRSRQKSHELEQEREVSARLRQVDQLKDQFLANTSHELRTPLNGIIGITESLRDGVAGVLPARAIDNLRMISDAGKRLSHLINDLLDFSRLKNKDLILSLSPVDIHAVVDVVLRFSQSLARDKPLRLINSVPEELPLACADENRLQQILYNLVGNAVKFTREGTVEVLAREENGQLYITVRDTGIGIPEDQQSRIFESFEQVDGSEIREFGGTGLGLSVSRQLVELHGGTIGVESQPGKGAAFTFSLPVHENQERPEFGKEETTGPAISTLHEEGEVELSADNGVFSENISILVVDDEPVNRRVLQNHLSLAGYKVTETGHGEDALRLLDKKGRFDLVLLDVMMPGLSGYEVCAKIRENYLASELPVVLLTAKNRVTDLVTGFNAGANDYLTKPFSKNELLSRIKTHLNLHGIHKATSKFVPSEFIRSVGRNMITEVTLGDHTEKEVTVLFSDIRDYTSLAENMTPEENFKFVNSYVGKMGPIIHDQSGFVNQYLGDGIMALFPHSGESALKAAVAMQRKVRAYNEERISQGKPAFEIGIGLHTGSLIMGIIGDIYRNDTAIIADTVNTSSRMEGLSKHFGAKIILSEETLRATREPEQYGLRYLGQVRVKGKEKTLGIYECYDGDTDRSIALKNETLADFNRGITHFMAYEFPKATAAFDHILSLHPDDRVARYFMSKSAEYTLAGLPRDQGFVNIMDEK